MSRPREYHVRIESDGYTKGYSLFFEDGDELARVPEAAHILFRTEDEAFAFAHELEMADYSGDDPNNLWRDAEFPFAENH